MSGAVNSAAILWNSRDTLRKMVVFITDSIALTAEAGKRLQNGKYSQKMKPLLIDVMIGDEYVCQLKYTKHGFPDMVDGKIIEIYREKDIKAFIEEARPSLKNKKYTISFSNQRV